VPVESNNAAQVLEPQRIGKPQQQFPGTEFKDDRGHDLPGKGGHPSEKPGRGRSPVQRRRQGPGFHISSIHPMSHVINVESPVKTTGVFT